MLFQTVRLETVKRVVQAAEQDSATAAGSNKTALEQQQQVPKPKGWRQRIRERESLLGHRTFYVIQVAVAIAVMIFCMTQLAVSADARQKCSQNKAMQKSTAAISALQTLAGAGFNTTGITQNIFNQAAAALNPPPPPATPMLALLANGTVLDTNRPWTVTNLTAVPTAGAASSCSTLTPRTLPEKAASAWSERCSFPAGGIVSVALGADVWCPAASGSGEYNLTAVVTPTEPATDAGSLTSQLFWTCLNVTSFNATAANFTGAIKVPVNANFVVNVPTICVLDDGNNTCFDPQASPPPATAPATATPGAAAATTPGAPPANPPLGASGAGGRRKLLAAPHLLLRQRHHLAPLRQTTAPLQMTWPAIVIPRTARLQSSRASTCQSLQVRLIRMPRDSAASIKVMLK
jgi:hypothetical protein